MEKLQKLLEDTFLQMSGLESLSEAAVESIKTLAVTINERMEQSEKDLTARLDEERKEDLAATGKFLEAAYTKIVESRLPDLIQLAEATELQNFKSTLVAVAEAAGFAVAPVGPEVLADDRVKKLTESQATLTTERDEAKAALETKNNELLALRTELKESRISAVVAGLPADQATQVTTLCEASEDITTEAYATILETFLKENSDDQSDVSPGEGDKTQLNEQSGNPKPAKESTKKKRSPFRW